MSDHRLEAAAMKVGTIPDWVKNVRSSPQGPLGIAALTFRRGHRTATIAASLGIAAFVAVRRLRPGLRAPSIFDSCASTALVVVLSVAALRWFKPPSSMNLLCARLQWRVDDPPPPWVEHVWVDLTSISPPMQLAVLVSEDAYFFWHFGFNPIEIWRAWRYNRFERASGRKRRGGSTISQQVAKNLFLLPTQSYMRKALEGILTLLIEGLWSKRRILEVYLNIVHFGSGAFGVEAKFPQLLWPCRGSTHRRRSRLAHGGATAALPLRRGPSIPIHGGDAARHPPANAMVRRRNADSAWRPLTPI